MPKTILITGSTDGLGLETARRLAAAGHRVLLHGRSRAKLDDAEQALAALPGAIETYLADLSRIEEIEAMSRDVAAKHDRLDVLINNAGVYRVAAPRTANGLDVRFAVNTIAPYLLTQRMLPLMEATGRVINLSSAAQAPVNTDALVSYMRLADMDGYAQSKLALIMWASHMALAHPEGPAIVSINPGSLLSTKMVREGFGVAGRDIGIGADILVRAALAKEFADASGRYFDNDAGCFAQPHPDGLDPEKSARVVAGIEAVLARTVGRSPSPDQRGDPATHREVQGTSAAP